MIIAKLADVKILMDRGLAIFGSFKNAVLISASLKVIFSLTILQSIFLTIMVLIVFYIVGLIDTRKLKLMQTENRLVCTKYNPQLNKIGKRKI